MGKKHDKAALAAMEAQAASEAAAKKKPAKQKKKTPAKKAPSFSREEIALKAYFIAEHRHRHGIHGDEHSDWIEAERQLKKEHSKKAAKKSAKRLKKSE